MVLFNIIKGWDILWLWSVHNSEWVNRQHSWFNIKYIAIWDSYIFVTWFILWVTKSTYGLLAWCFRGLPAPAKLSNSPLDIDSWIKSSTSLSISDLSTTDKTQNFVPTLECLVTLTEGHFHRRAVNVYTCR